MLVNDEMLFNEHFTIINKHFTIVNEHFTIISLKYTIICSFDHHGEAAPTTNETEVTQVKVKGTFFFIQILFHLKQN